MNKLILFIKEFIKRLLDLLFPKTMFILADGDELATADNKLFYSKGE